MRVLALLIAVFFQAQPQSKITVIRGAKVYPGNSAPVENANVILSNGRIDAVGRDLPIPPEANVIEGGGKTLIPGLIDAASRLFIGDGERGPGSAEQNVLDGLDLYQRDFLEAVEQGVTTVYVGPLSAGIVNGLGAVIRLDDAHTILLKDAAIKLTLGASGGDTSTALQRYESYPQLKQTFEAARQYAASWDKYRRDLTEFELKKKDKKEDAKEPAKPKIDPRNEVLARALDPKRNLIVRIEAHSADAITLALRLAEEFKLRIVLEHATEAGPLAPAIAKAKIPVVVGPIFRTGPYSVDYLKHSSTTAAVLVKAGVQVAIGSFGDEHAGQFGPGATRFLADAAAFAASKGLSREQALGAITLEPAKILGIDKTHGSIEKGKIADLVLLSGEPFDSATRVDRTLIHGETVYTRGDR
jgi:imidazolonepropionase-like amidohydrolase